MIAKITFEDKDDEVEIGIENVMADKPTEAQKAALQLFVKIKAYIKKELEVK
jgi:hypothetical protein